MVEIGLAFIAKIDERGRETVDAVAVHLVRGQALSGMTTVQGAIARVS